jgi:hypothetical protein
MRRELYHGTFVMAREKIHKEPPGFPWKSVFLRDFSLADRTLAEWTKRLRRF